MPLQYGQFLQAIQSGKLENTVSRFTKIENLDSPLFPLTNTKYILAVKYTDKMERSPNGIKLKDIYNKPYLKPVFEHGTVVILENQKYLPRAFVVSKAEVIEDDTQLINILTDPSTDFLQTVFVETLGAVGAPLVDAHAQPWAGTRPAPTTPNYQISWRQTTGNTRRLTVQSDLPGYLVLLESHNPGWHAEICNQSQPKAGQPMAEDVRCQMSEVLRANFTFMAFPIGRGTSHITLTYYPNSFKYGLWITGVGISIFIMLSLIQYKKRK